MNGKGCWRLNKNEEAQTKRGHHLNRLGVPHQRFHDLRQAFATLLIEACEDLGVVSRILGHADFATTADVYAHLTPVMLERSAQRISAVLARQEPA